MTDWQAALTLAMLFYLAAKDEGDWAWILQALLWSVLASVFLLEDLLALFGWPE